jgi:hypothetical protein
LNTDGWAFAFWRVVAAHRGNEIAHRHLAGAVQRAPVLDEPD